MTIAYDDKCPFCGGELGSYEPVSGEYIIICSECGEEFIELCECCESHGVLKFQEENR